MLNIWNKVRKSVSDKKPAVVVVSLSILDVYDMEGDPNITTSKLFNLILSIIDKSFYVLPFLREKQLLYMLICHELVMSRNV